MWHIYIEAGASGKFCQCISEQQSKHNTHTHVGEEGSGAEGPCALLNHLSRFHNYFHRLSCAHLSRVKRICASSLRARQGIVRKDPGSVPDN